MELKHTFQSKRGMNEERLQTSVQEHTRRGVSRSIQFVSRLFAVQSASAIDGKRVVLAASAPVETTPIDPKSPEGRANKAYAELLEVKNTWNRDSAFISGVRNRLLGRKEFRNEKLIRLRDPERHGKWGKGTSSDRAAELLHTEGAIKLLAGYLHNKKSKYEALEACEKVAARERSKVRRFREAIEATRILEDYMRGSIFTGWNSVYELLVVAIPKESGKRRGKRVLHLTPVFMRKVLEIHKRSKLSFKDLLEPDKTARYSIATSLDRVKAMPGRGEVDRTTRDSFQAAQMAERISGAAHVPVVFFCNARGGTVYGYTQDSVETQIHRQLDVVNQKMFWNQVELIKGGWGKVHGKELAILQVATKWMKDKHPQLHSLTILVIDEKIPSSRGYQGKVDKKLLGPIAKQAFKMGIPVVFVDGSPKHMSNSADRFERIVDNYSGYKFHHQKGFKNDAVTFAKKNAKKKFAISINAHMGNGQLWADDNPHFLGDRVRKHSTDDNEKIDTILVEPDGHLVFLSEKIEVTAKVGNLDAKGENWYQRNFRGFLSRYATAPQEGTPEYSRQYREWVPFISNADGSPKFDRFNYVTIKEESSRARSEAGYVSSRMEFQALLHG